MARTSIGRSIWRKTWPPRSMRRIWPKFSATSVENAIKWAASKVRIAGRKEDKAVTVSVEDDGPGIPDDQIGPFSPAEADLTRPNPVPDWASRSFRDLVEAYGGTLALERSALGGLLGRGSAARSTDSETNAFMRASGP